MINYLYVQRDFEVSYNLVDLRDKVATDVYLEFEGMALWDFTRDNPFDYLIIEDVCSQLNLQQINENDFITLIDEDGTEYDILYCGSGLGEKFFDNPYVLVFRMEYD